MKRIFAYFYTPMAVLYLFMSWVYPTDPVTMAKRHLGVGEARVVALSVAIPLIIIWAFAIYGSWRFKDYAKSIKQYKDGAVLMKLASGMQLLAVYLSVRSVSKILLNYAAHRHPGLTTATELFITYINLVMPLAAYLLIGQAARNLFYQVKAKVPLWVVYGFALLFSILGVTFCYATYTAAGKLSPSDWLITTKYDIPVVLRVMTIIVPLLFMWFVGLIAAYEIYLYQRLVKGVLYRRAFKLLSIGLMLEIVASIVVQFITSISANLRQLPIGAIFIIVYGVLITVAVAFGMIARGVRHLKRLDEV